MDISNYTPLYGMTLTDYEKEKVQSKRRVVEELHTGGFVHGDVWDTNILIDRGSLADDVKVHIIDFDWAGPVGTTNYPMGVNRRTIKRLDGAQDWKPITKEHDIEMISNLSCDSSGI
jgi:RIO-like serine/threonine protein kinase